MRGIAGLAVQAVDDAGRRERLRARRRPAFDERHFHRLAVS
ncbi:hypothetical protein AB0C96_40165 [Streptomyces sp. NPDC048506]